MTTKELLDEYAVLFNHNQWCELEVCEVCFNNRIRHSQIETELEASIRKEVVEEVIARVKDYKNYYNPIGDEVNQERHRTAENIIKMIKGITLN